MWDTEVTQIMEDKPIPKLGAPSKDTTRLHKEHPPVRSKKEENDEAEDNHEEKDERPSSRKMGLRQQCVR